MTVPLPPLPGDDEGYRPGGRSIVDILTVEHRQLTALVGELTAAATPEPRRAQVLDVLTAAVSRHLSAEEQYLYPAARAALPHGADAVDREVAADAELLRVLRELAGAGVADIGFAATAADLGARLERHVTAVNRELLTGLGATASEAELIRLGNRLEIAEEAAPTRPHPATPLTPPWNRIVEPVLGVVDKLRDALSGRRTYLRDLRDRPRG